MTLSRRISYHLNKGAIVEHFKKCHNTTPSRNCIVENTTIRYKIPDTIRLKIMEALLIKDETPVINRQDTGVTRTLYLYN